MEGVRKPEEKIYTTLLKRLNEKAEDVLFLDDIGGNLKAAKKLGFRTLKVR